MKKFLASVLALTMCFMFCGCGKKDGKSQKTNLVTSCYPVYVIALNLTEGIENVTVENMAENHKGCLHNFQLRSEDLKKIEKSDAFIINGAGMENFLSKVVNELPKVKIVDSSKNIELIKDDDCDCENCGHNHEYNPHIWVSVENYIKQTQNIAEELKKIDPQNAEGYQKNAEIYIQKLKDLKSRMHSELKNAKSKNIVTFHEAFPYFAKEFGLTIAAVINHEPESEPDSKELSETIAIIKKLKITALFAEPQYTSTAAQIISKETGAKIYILDPAATGENSKDAYINIMEKNLEVLKTALN